MSLISIGRPRQALGNLTIAFNQHNEFQGEDIYYKRKQGGAAQRGHGVRVDDTQRGILVDFYSGQCAEGVTENADVNA